MTQCAVNTVPGEGGRRTDKSAAFRFGVRLEGTVGDEDICRA